MILKNGTITLIDEDDYEVLNKYNWFMNTTTGRVFRWRSKKRDNPALPMCIFLHRQIMGLPPHHVDHINGDVLDNRKSNLRICSNKENSRNTAQHKDNMSGYKGVSWDKVRQKWIAQIGVDYKSYNLGGYEHIKDAAHAYNAAAVKYFGDFARLNIIL